MASSKSTSSKVYQTIGDHIDKKLTERIKEGVTEDGNHTIQRIRGELFDVLTVGDDEKSRKEIGKKIKEELEKKLLNKKNAIKEKKKQGENPSKREQREVIILERLIGDVDYRLRFGVANPNISGDKNISGDINRNIYLNLDKNDKFDKDVIKDVVDDIINSDMDDIKNNILLKRLIKSDKYYEEIRKELKKYGKMSYKGLYKAGRLEDILDCLESMKNKHSGDGLEKKLLDFKVNGGKALRLRERNDIKKRFEELQPGDRILLNDGTSIKVITPPSAMYGNEITYEDVRTEHGKGIRTENFNTFKSYRCPVGDIKEIIIFKEKPTEKPEKPEKTEKTDTPDDEPEGPTIIPPVDSGNDDGNDDGNNNPKPPKKHKKTYITPKITIKDDPDTPTVFEENVVLSDVSESYEDMISRMVENEINEEWHNTSKFNVFKRGKLFLMRGRIRKKKIAEMKKNYQKTPFTNNGLINAEMSTQAARHDLEEILGGKGVNREAFVKIKRESLISEAEVKAEGRRGKPFKEMCQEYVAGTISQVEFQNKFNALVKKLGAAINQKFLASNVLEKLDAIKNDNLLLGSIADELTQYLSDHNDSHFDAIRAQIDADFKKYRRDPRFRKEIMDILGNTAGLTKEQLDEKIEKFMRHQKALAKMSTQNLQIKLDLLTNGKGAYQTNNKDRENWLFRFGNKLDKMPRWGQALTVAGISASGIAVGLLGGSALAATATVSGLVGAKNFVKKWTHHTKEQNTYEKNLTRNYEEEIAKMKEWERIRDEKDDEGKYTHNWFTRYKAKRQLELYGKTTQEHLQNENEGNTKEISAVIYGLLDRYDTLSNNERNALHCILLDAKARLEVYWDKGHNFLKSKDANQIERDFYELENALTLSASRILGTGATLKDISLVHAYDGSGKAVNYNDLLNLYKKDYNSASKKFRGERAWLATKWGLGTAALTFTTAAIAQKIAGTGMFAKDAIPATQGTPNIIDTSTTNTVTDTFQMGQYELYGGNRIFLISQNNISGLNSTDTVIMHIGSGTDGTAVRVGSSLLDHNTYLAKLANVKDVIEHSSLSNKADLISQLDGGFATSGFTNTDLHGMRCLEAIEETVKGAGNFAGKLNLSYDPIMDIDGAIAHDAASRMSSVFLEISKFIPGEPGQAAVEGGKQWLVFGLPWFSNTFKRKTPNKDEKQPTDKQPKDIPPKNNIGQTESVESTDKTITNTEKDKKSVTAPIVVPPMKSDETKEVEENTDKKEETKEELKKKVKDDLYKVFHEDYMDENDFKEKYKYYPWALQNLEEAKDFRKDFPKTNFYDRDIVNGLKEKYKENDYILSRIRKELNSELDGEFKQYLEKSDIDRYKDKAKTLVDSALSDKNYAKLGIRPMILINVSDELNIPFYISSGDGNKPGVPTGKFYPIFGIKGRRLNKGTESEINNYYGSPLLAAIAKELDKRNKENKIDISDRKFSDEEFEEKINLGKEPVPNRKGAYNNINEVLKKISKIKDSE